MEAFYNQSWFWVGLFTAVASLSTVLIKELINSRSQVKIERLKLYESNVFDAHNKLYKFISSCYNDLWPPNNPESQFYDFMSSYYNEVKKHMLFYSSEIREVLEELEGQYIALKDPDLIPKKTFDKFYDDDLMKFMQRLEKAVKLRVDILLDQK